ncbi:MAG: TetR/AcrR family transcriptional regulator [Burkholderiaceae bacterium]|nr:TetR/AcrR family transcriptional regulator [Burkholderiaceae bacterium]
MRKGEQTKAAIVDVAVALASLDGLEGLTIARIAERMSMSKSGVFAHFGSREDLQIEVVREYHRRFEEEVFMPAIREKRGLPRLLRLFDNWVMRVTQEIDSGCIYISGAVEYDEREGPVREQLVESVKTWLNALLKAVQQSVELRQLRSDTEPKQLVFEMHGLILALHHDARFLKQRAAVERAKKGFERLIASYRAQ